MKDKIYRVAEKIFLNPDMIPHDVTGDGIPETFCNYALHVFMSKFGYSKFKGLLANQIIDYMNNHRDEWDYTRNHVEAHAAVNGGNIVIAGQKAENHGHVCIILPSEDMIYSGSWQTLVPLCMNIGKKNFFNKGISKAFGTPPTYYIYRKEELL